jgi:hypothetical protein
MKITKLLLVLAVASAGVPAAADAAKTCQDQLNQCLNDSYDTKGFSRFLADVECSAQFAGCIRRLL